MKTIIDGITSTPAEEKVEKSKPRAFYPNGSVVELKEGETYWYIEELGDVCYDTYTDDNQYDLYILADQNAYLTEEDAKKSLERKKYTIV